MVERYNQSAKLFRIRHASQRIGDDAEDLDLMTLQDVLIMGKEYGDARADWGRTRDERIRTVTFLSIFEETQEERRYINSDRGDSMILIEVIARKMSKENATMRMHQEKRCCMMMSQEIYGSY